MELIYDIGMYNGDDTALYLNQGYRVIAVDGSKDLIESARCRFSDEIRSGALTLINAVITEETGPSALWVCDEFPMWNSCNRSIASRANSRHHRVLVPGIRFRDILQQYGVPHYLKIDIEGNDYLCLMDITQREAPLYISVESECCGGDEHLSESEFLRTLLLLREAGYTQFKLIDQQTLASITSDDKCSRRWWPEHSCERRQLEERFNHLFPVGCTGPWGNSASGPWMGFQEAADIYRRWRQAFFEMCRRTPYAFWCDWHATYLRPGRTEEWSHE